MPISKEFNSVHFKDFEVNFSQITPSGFLKITELCNFFQLTAAEHAELGGISFVDLQVHNQAWVLSKMRIEIKKMPRWKDKITIKTWIVNIENSRSLRAMNVFINNEIVASTETLWVVLNTEKRRPETLLLPHHHFEKYPENFANLVRVSSVPQPENMQLVENRTVVFSDLDLVNHVNHIQYLEWCLDALPSEKLLKNKIKTLEMNFVSELVLNDKIVIQSEVQSDVQYFWISKNRKNSFGLSVGF